MSELAPNPHRDLVASVANRNEMAVEYAALIRRNGRAWRGWGELNHAILERWSMAGLTYIKERAWKLVSGAGA